MAFICRLISGRLRLRNAQQLFLNVNRGVLSYGYGVDVYR